MIETRSAKVLQDVSPANGLVRVETDCLVLGTVLDGARLHVGGSVRIEGGVESAEVAAGGAIEILRGVSGNGGGSLRGGGDLSARFLDHAKIEVAGTATVDTSILHCSIRAGGNVSVVTPGGIAAGGRVVCGGNLEAGVVGGAFGTDMYVSVGLAPDVLDEMEELLARRDELARELKEARAALKLAKGQPEKMKQTAYKLMCLRREATEADRARTDLLARMRPRTSAMIVARANLRAGVHGRVAGATYRVRRDSGPSRVVRRTSAAAIWPLL